MGFQHIKFCLKFSGFLHMHREHDMLIHLWMENFTCFKFLTRVSQRSVLCCPRICFSFQFILRQLEFGLWVFNMRQFPPWQSYLWMCYQLQLWKSSKPKDSLCHSQSAISKEIIYDSRDLENKVVIQETNTWTFFYLNVWTVPFLTLLSH